MSSQKKILIVEDEVIVAKDLQIRLQSRGYAVPKIVNRGMDAITYLKDHSADLILMDIHLKGTMDGVQTATEIQQNHYSPIIYLTAFSDIQTIKEAIRSEPFGYIIKPYEEQTLFIQIEVALYKSKMDAAVRNREKWYHSILANLKEGVVTTDMQGCINFINTAGLILLETQKNAMIDAQIIEELEFLDEDGRPFHSHPVERTLTKGVATYSETVMVQTKKKKLKPIEYHITPLKDEQQVQVGVLMVMRERQEQVEKSSRFYQIQKTMNPNTYPDPQSIN